MKADTADDLFRTWNRHRRNNNCYAFAFDRLQPGADEKLQPGEVAGLPEIPDGERYQCSDLKARILKDNPGTVPLHPKEPSPTGQGHRVALFVDNQGESRDYHFYREMPDGTWWHKPGSLPVSKLDDAGNVIRDPLEADRDYVNEGAENTNYNYATFCGFFWVPQIDRQPIDREAEDSWVVAAVALFVMLVILFALGLLFYY